MSIYIAKNCHEQSLLVFIPWKRLTWWKIPTPRVSLLQLNKALLCFSLFDCAFWKYVPSRFNKGTHSLCATFSQNVSLRAKVKSWNILICPFLTKEITYCAIEVRHAIMRRAAVSLKYSAELEVSIFEWQESYQQTSRHIKAFSPNIKRLVSETKC